MDRRRGNGRFEVVDNNRVSVLSLLLRVSMLHKKVQELRHEKCQMAKAAERERLNYEEQKNQLLQQIHLVRFLVKYIVKCCDIRTHIYKRNLN